MNNKNSIKFDGEGDYINIPDENESYNTKNIKDVCYCCHKFKIGNLIPIVKTNNDCEHRFVCCSCNHLKPKNEQEKL